MISRTSEIPDLNKYALIRWKMTAYSSIIKGRKLCLCYLLAVISKKKCLHPMYLKIKIEARGAGRSIIGGGAIFTYSCLQTVKTIDFKI